MRTGQKRPEASLLLIIVSPVALASYSLRRRASAEAAAVAAFVSEIGAAVHRVPGIFSSVRGSPQSRPTYCLAMSKLIRY
jgi:hypothetical protein